MIEDYAPQYRKPCVLIEDAEWPGVKAEAIKAFAEQIGATYNSEPGQLDIVIQFPGRPQELYTYEAVYRSCQHPIWRGFSLEQAE